MTPTDWREHTHDPSDILNKQHGPNLHTHGADGKMGTLMGKPVMQSRCHLDDCDCGYVIDRLLLALEHTRDIVHRTHCPAPATLPQKCWKECDEAMDAMLEAGWMPLKETRR